MEYNQDLLFALINQQKIQGCNPFELSHNKAMYTAALDDVDYDIELMLLQKDGVLVRVKRDKKTLYYIDYELLSIECP
jgi:hypothetical protein